VLIAALIPVGLLVGAVIAIVVGEEQRQHRRDDVVSAWHSAKNREEVRTRLGDPSFTTNITVGARNVRCDVFNADDSLVDASVQFSFCYDRDGKRIAGPDPLEPNDDIPYLHTYRIPPLTRPGKPWANIHGRLDDWPHGGIENRLFDDEDVYRIWLPAQHAVHIRLEPTTDIGLEVWDTATPNVYLTGAARNRHLIAESDTPGTTTRRLTLSRPSAATAYVFLDLYLFENGPNHTEYHLTVTPAT
jgi:hypothetical protein